jgi:hypothetical protein
MSAAVGLEGDRSQPEHSPPPLDEDASPIAGSHSLAKPALSARFDEETITASATRQCVSPDQAMVWWTGIIQRHQRPAQRPSKVRPRISPRPHPTGRGYIRPRRDWCLYCRAHLRFNECRAIAGVRTSVSNDDPKEVATLRAFERLHHVSSGDRANPYDDPLDIAGAALCLGIHRVAFHDQFLVLSPTTNRSGQLP